LRLLYATLNAPASSGRELADEGRKEEARQKLEEVEAKL